MRYTPPSFAGKKHSKATKEKLRKFNLGKKHSDTIKKKIGDARRGKSSWNKGKTSWSKGKKFSSIHKKRIGIAQKGSLHHNWQGGITPIIRKIRNSLEYKLWRKAVFERDNYTCRFCGQRGNKLNADHIKPFALFPELRLAIDNGRTLCEMCHRKTDTYGGKIPKINL